MPSALFYETAVSIAGADAVREGAPADAVEGVVPRIVAEPASGEAVGALLAWATREKLSVLARGSGTKLGWGLPPRAVDLLISTGRLTSVVAHRHGDGFRLRMNLQFVVDIADVKFQCVVADAELFSRRNIVVAFGQHFQKSGFVRSQIVIHALRRTDFTKKFDDASGNFGFDNNTFARC